MKKATLLPVALALCASCQLPGAGDVAQVRSALESFIEAAREGRIERALDFIDPSSPERSLLAELDEADPQSRSRELERMQRAAREGLTGAELFIGSVTIQSDRAEMECSVLRAGQERPFTVYAVRRGRSWLLESVPAF